jgi:hypothetical protein
MDAFRFTRSGACRPIDLLARKIGQRRDAIRAPMQVRNGRRPHGRLLGQPAAPSKNGRVFVQPMGSTSQAYLAAVPVATASGDQQHAFNKTSLEVASAGSPQALTLGSPRADAWHTRTIQRSAAKDYDEFDSIVVKLWRHLFGKSICGSPRRGSR